MNKMKCYLTAGYCTEQLVGASDRCSGEPQTEKCPHRGGRVSVQFKPGDRVRCVDAKNACPDGTLEEGKVYTVLEMAFGSDVRLVEVESNFSPGQHPSWRLSRFEAVESPKTLTDLDTMLALLKPVTEVRAWHINEYVGKDGEVVKFQGTVLIHGSENDGPYTEYIFDLGGKLVRAASYYAEGLTFEVA